MSVGAGQTYCHHHDPARAEARSRAASRAARSKPRRELAAVKAELHHTIDGVLDGTIERGIAAVAFQGYGYLLRTVELERRLSEADFEERLYALETRLSELGESGARWGA